jgi:TonB-dependent starch-binding outer membrane protein SusC
MRKSKFFLLVALLFCGQLLFAQTREVTGTVTDANGSPLNGASVRVKGSRTGVIAANDGSFKINTAPNSLLLISAVGYESMEVSIGTKTNISTQLTIDTKALSEVVVTGTGSAVSKKKLAIAVESVDIAKQTKVSTGGVLDQLVGQVAGAQISSVGGQPGQAPSIVLRGINSINRGTNPMIILDGVQLGATGLNSIDLNTIERVEVVQGAAAATLYGAQGANGVIQLFSKKGKKGQINIDVSVANTTTKFLNIGNVHKNNFHSYGINANGEVTGNNGSPLKWNSATGLFSDDFTNPYRNGNINYNALDPNAQSNIPYDKNLQYYDHYKMFFVTGHNRNGSLSISGGGDKTDFAITGSFNHQESNFKNNGALDRGNFTSNIGAELFKGFKFRSVTQVIYDKNTVNWDRTIIYAINNARPWANFDQRMDNGQYAAFFGSGVGVNHWNPNYLQENSTTKEITQNLAQSFNANYKFKKFVELDAKYGLNYSKGDNLYTYTNQRSNPNLIALGGSPTTPNTSSYGIYNFGSAADGEVNIRKTQNLFQNFVGTATITTDFEKDFKIKIPIRTTTLGAFDYRKSEFKDYYVYGLTQPAFTPFTASNYTTQRIQTDRTTPFVTYGFLANQRIEYGEIAGISGGLRSDFSSAFGRGSKPQTFPRFDAYFRPAQMNFWKNSGKLSDIVTDWKLRAAFGKAGIQPGAFDRYPILSTKTFGNSQGLFFPNTLPNPDLNVEISKELEIGTDLFFNVTKGKWFKTAALTFTYWDRSTENAIYSVDVAPSLGVGGNLKNAFTLSSHGIQAQLIIPVLGTKNMNWNFTANFGKQTSEITKVIGSDVILLSSAGSTNYILRPGLKIGQLFGYKMLRSVTQVNGKGDPVIPAAQQANYEVASNGYVVNKTTKQPIADPTGVDFGDPNPKFNMAFINDFSYKGFLTFNMQWDWVYKSHLYNQTKSWMYRDGISGDYEKPITINGQTGAWTAFYRGVYQAGANNGTKDYFYEDATFLRLRNISIGFDIAKFKTIKGVRKCQLVLSGRNLITKTKYTGFDPEINSGAVTGNSASAWDRGTDHNTMPNLKYMTVGLNLGF